MTLFAYLATPLLVVALAARGAAPEVGRRTALLPWFAGAALLALLLFPLLNMVARAFPPLYEPRLLLLRLLAADHAAPLVAALAVTLGLRRYRNVRRRRSGLLQRAQRARREREPRPRIRARRRAELPYLLATLGGFFSMFAVLEQLTHYADPSFYRLVLLPLLRLALLSGAAVLLAAATGARVWWRALALLAILVLPLVTAAIAYGDVIRRPDLAAAGSVLVFLAALLPLLLCYPAEASDDSC